ncbi:MAG: hypothetical protein RLY15_1061, partial [Bacteroidota bacterium]
MDLPFCVFKLDWIKNIFETKYLLNMSNVTTASSEAKWWGGGKSPFNVEYGKVMMWYFLMSD